MKIKSALLVGSLAIFTLSVGFAKTYTVSISSPVKAGSIELKAGDYKLAVDGNKVTFTEVKSNKSFSTDGKIENATKSYDTTRMDTTTEGSTTVVKDIELGGSKIKIDF